MSKVESFEQLLVHEIVDLLSAEEQLIEALPKMEQAATSKPLKKAIQAHLKETEQQFQRLQTIAEALKLKASDKKICKAMKGLISEGESAIREIEAGPIRDAAIIGAAQRVEHYEMAGYGTARAFAQLLELQTVVKLLSETYDEEVAADKLLSEIAESQVNPKALAVK